jgi:prolyl oligopeptidase
MGNSNGGLLISSVLTQRPDLFKLAIPINGIHDMLRKEALDPRFGSGWSSEYGNSNDAESFKYLAKYSPINNIQEIQYPAF